MISRAERQRIMIAWARRDHERNERRRERAVERRDQWQRMSRGWLPPAQADALLGKRFPRL